jgi:hypothetical protein
MHNCPMPDPIHEETESLLNDGWHIDDRPRGPWRSKDEFVSLYFSDLVVLWGDLKSAGAQQAGLLTRLDFDAFCAFAYRFS